MRNYMNNYREKQKALTAGKPSCKTNSKTNSKTNVSQADKDIEEEKEKEREKEIYNIVVSYLNEKAGTSYRTSTAKTQTAIKARLNEGFTVDDFKTVIDKKCAEWLGTEWEKFLRPETLFGTKFEGYLNANNKKGVNNGKANSNPDTVTDKIGTWL